MKYTSPASVALLAAAMLGLFTGSRVVAQTTNRPPRRSLDAAPPTPPHRKRLILKDGSYQVVMSYQLKGSMISYVSAERGATEELPANLVDWDATRRWEQRHTASADTPADSGQSAPTIDPELLKEEADRAALTPEVAPNLALPEQDSVVALDQYRGTPELVPLIQSDGELNRTTGHNILKLNLNPRAASHSIVQLKGVESPIQFHVDTPVIYLRIGEDTGIKQGGTPLTVDTHGAAAPPHPAPASGSASSGYVIVRADVRTDARVLASFNISGNNAVQRQQDVIETTAEPLPGGHWMRITPKHPLDFGEYALMEVLSDREVNLSVWDFGVHPAAPENKDVLKPQVKKPITLEHRARPE
ncbi:MAG: hypothetical protein NVSMB62_22900 [Acidobacteriaceae bacterium]